ncbi:MAG: DUF3800 domain-containing protein [Chloroflexi bacterium]|nr:DUF3800 domain-containing protein [Chloroflexota bacterium]
MKFCYLDESGIGNEPYAVMVGVIVDAQRMHVTKKNWADLLGLLSKIVGQPISEIHTREFYSGNSPWRGLTGEVRAQIISAIFDWLRKRKHHIVYSAVDKAKFSREFAQEPHADEIGTLWRFMALHVCLAIQKHFQSEERNKGHTVFIFDNEEREASNLITLIKNPPVWTDTYYSRAPQQEQLDQMVDVPYFGDSRHVGLIQLADFVSFFLRRFIEIKEGVIPPTYSDERTRVEGWAKIALAQSIPKSAIYLSKGRCECADLFCRYAPACML